MIDIRRRTTYFFLAVSLGHVLLISAQVQSKSGMPVAQDLAFGAYARLTGAIAAAGTGVGSLWRRYVAIHGVVAENAQLKEQIAGLQGQLEAQKAVTVGVRSLQDVLQLQMTTTQKTIAARVIAGDPAPGALTITIDRGAEDGVKKDMAVIAPGGVVGRVLASPSPHAALVQLLISRNAAAGAVIDRISAGGVVVGGDDPPLRMQFVANSFEVKPGDVVTTSGQDGVFPKGFPIGTVDSAERGNSAYKLIAIKPAANFSHLDVVLVVLDQPPPVTGGGDAR